MPNQQKESGLSEDAWETLSACSVMYKIIREYNLNDFTVQGNLYHELTAAIVYQQISIKAAESIYKRYRDMVGWDYTPKEILQYSIEDLRSVGLSNQKASYILNIAEYFSQRPKLEQQIIDLTNTEVIKQLTEIKGVGVWTVKMALMFYLGREDVFPYEDLGVEMAMVKLFDLSEDRKQRRKEMQEIAERWKPFRSLASFYLWAWKREN